VRATVQSAVLSLPGTSSGVFINLRNSADNYADDPDRVFPAASLIKLPIAGAAYERVASGQWQLGDTFTLTDEVKVGGTGILREQPAGTTYTLDQLVEIMLVNSDNTAANMLVDRLGGFGAVNAFSQAQGMTNTVMRRKLYDLAAQGRGVDNTTTSGDVSRFFLRLQSGALIDGLVSDRLRTILARRGQVDKNWALLNLPPNTIALHMTGTGDNQRNDVILVTSGETQYLLVLMVTDPNDAGIETALTRVSATIYGAVVGR
jgi:beta-lactamase class A